VPEAAHPVLHQRARLTLGGIFAPVLISVACSAQLPSVSEPPHPSDEPTVSGTPSTEASPTTTTYAVGDVITMVQDGQPSAELTVLEVREADKYMAPDGMSGEPPQTSGYVFLAASVRYAALADGARYGSFQFQVLVDGQPVAKSGTATYGPQPILTVGTLAQGGVAEGWLLYEVPPTGEVRLSYTDPATLDDPPVFEVVLREAQG
jgi:hypothetical protein